MLILNPKFLLERDDGSWLYYDRDSNKFFVSVQREIKLEEIPLRDLALLINKISDQEAEQGGEDDD